MKGKTNNLRQKNKTKTLFLCLISALILSFLFRATTLINYEQESMNISNKMPQSSNGNAPEQHWNKTWGGSANDSALCITLDSSDNIYITGICNVTSVPSSSISSSKVFFAQPPPPSNYGGDVVLLKYDSSGELQWKTTWGGSGRDEGRAIAVDSSDNIYLVGNSAEGDVIFIKYDSSGELIWDKSWNSLSSAMAITIDLEGNIFITGGQNGSVILWKYDSSGALLWERTWEDGNSGWGISVDSSNNIYVTGYQPFVDGFYKFDLFLLKYDSSGELQWKTTWGGSKFDDGHSIAIDSSNNIFVAGCCYSFGAGDNDLSVVKFNSVGQLQWNKTWGGNESEVGWDMLTLDSSGNIYLGAHTRSFGAGLSDGILVKYNSTGEQQWNTTWGGSGDDGFGSIIVDSSDNIFLTGYTESFGAGGEDIILVKYSQNLIPDDGFEISGYDLFLLFGLIGLISMIILRKMRKITIF